MTGIVRGGGDVSGRILANVFRRDISTLDLKYRDLIRFKDIVRPSFFRRFRVASPYRMVAIGPTSCRATNGAVISSGFVCLLVIFVRFLFEDVSCFCAWVVIVMFVEGEGFRGGVLCFVAGFSSFIVSRRTVGEATTVFCFTISLNLGLDNRCRHRRLCCGRSFRFSGVRWLVVPVFVQGSENCLGRVYVQIGAYGRSGDLCFNRILLIFHWRVLFNRSRVLFFLRRTERRCLTVQVGGPPLSVERRVDRLVVGIKRVNGSLLRAGELLRPVVGVVRIVLFRPCRFQVSCEDCALPLWEGSGPILRVGDPPWFIRTCKYVPLVGVTCAIVLVKCSLSFRVRVGPEDVFLCSRASVIRTNGQVNVFGEGGGYPYEVGDTGDQSLLCRPMSFVA